MLMALSLHLLVTAVSVYTNGTVFAADTNITFVAVTEETVPLEFTWYFGENPPVTTTSRSIRRRLSIPQWSVNTVFGTDAG